MSPASVSFDRWSPNSVRTVSVCGVDDDVIDHDQRHDIIAQARSSDPLYDAAAAQRLEFTNVDNERAGVRVVGAATTTESGGAATLQVHLAGRPTSTVTMRVSSSDPGEGLASVDTLTFEPGTWNVAQAVIVTGQDDNVVDRGQNYSLDFGPFVSEDVNWTAGTDRVWLTNTDND